MKKRYVVLILFSLLLVPRLSLAEPCNTVVISSAMPKFMQISTIRNALLGYEQGGVYGMCFQMDDPIELNSADFTESFKIELPAGETHNVYVNGLKVIISGDPVEHEIFKVNHAGSGMLIIEEFDFKDIKKGLLLKGTGKK